MLISHPPLHSSSGTASLHPPGKPTAQVNGLLLTSSAFTPISSTQMALTSQPSSQPYWSGLHTLATPSGSLHQLSNHTWGTSSPSMLTPTYRLTPWGHQWYNGSSTASSNTSVIGTADQQHLSPSQFSSTSSMLLPHRCHFSTPLSMWPSSWHLLDSCTLGNLL